jgi:hypothetical protein
MSSFRSEFHISKATSSGEECAAGSSIKTANPVQPHETSGPERVYEISTFVNQEHRFLWLKDEWGAQKDVLL